ncbi:MAG TPA: MBL fold metallo-hydrolase, partial [Candidatus Peregrinibacteria bacterium]|nr:MBL fold metallo-hydrolase [Candidatus Peregrinibacteria bacterium]
IDAFSAHAGKKDLDYYTEQIQGLEKIFLVHGEAEQMYSFAQRLEKKTQAEIFMPERGEEFSLK